MFAKKGYRGEERSERTRTMIGFTLRRTVRVIRPAYYLELQRISGG